ncbi:basic proline-rich protein-like [Canis lupus dingo]|uniref:basic proline-rich protein-like n=1 Tax=Canis lupus dingo TaxID=286419 RepID=UPI000DC7485C|nr:basic proline-rich protein-like [Canis lupus dingo]
MVAARPWAATGGGGPRPGSHHPGPARSRLAGGRGTSAPRPPRPTLARQVKRVTSGRDGAPRRAPAPPGAWRCRGNQRGLPWGPSRIASSRAGCAQSGGRDPARSPARPSRSRARLPSPPSNRALGSRVGPAPLPRQLQPRSRLASGSGVANTRLRAALLKARVALASRVLTPPRPAQEGTGRGAGPASPPTAGSGESEPSCAPPPSAAPASPPLRGAGGPLWKALEGSSPSPVMTEPSKPELRMDASFLRNRR